MVTLKDPNVPFTPWFGDWSTFCRYGCPALEDPHHIFVHCLAFQGLQNEYSQWVILDTSHYLCGATLPDPIHSHINHIITHLFWDDDSWLLGSSRFYLGLLPPLLPNPGRCPPPNADAPCLLAHVAHSCHTSAIHLAAHIWGSVMWHSALGASPPSHGSDLGLHGLDLALPSHLRHFLPS